MFPKYAWNHIISNVFLDYNLDNLRFYFFKILLWSIALIEDSAMVICLCPNLSRWRHCHGHLFVSKPVLLKTAMVICLCPNLSCWRHSHGHLFVSKPVLLKTLPWSSVCVQTCPAEDTAMVICLCPDLSCWRQCCVQTTSAVVFAKISTFLNQ